MPGLFLWGGLPGAPSVRLRRPPAHPPAYARMGRRLVEIRRMWTCTLWQALFARDEGHIVCAGLFETGKFHMGKDGIVLSLIHI